jgi:serine/threonine protein kinase
MIETGKVLQQRYRIDKQIGQGGMGSVYIATDLRFNSTVAIKETLFMDDSYRKAIEREARLLNSLKHPALPRVSDHFEEENVQFLVMEYIPGEDLGVMMERDGGRFEVPDVLRWADQLLDALDFLHNQKIPVIHRDIKPQNLKLTSRGQIVLLDFGLAKGNPTDAGHQTAAKSIFGYSRNYASLEQIQGTGTDPRSDLYSLSATLYHLLTLEPPEDALTRAMNVLSQKQDPLVPAHRLRGEIPVGVSAILHNAMDLNANSRPESAAAMREMLADHERFSDAEFALADGEERETSHSERRTRLMARGTRQDDAYQTDIKTQILPLIGPDQTSVNTDSPARAAHPRNLVRKASAAALILAGIAAGAVYFADPALFGSDSKPDAVPEVISKDVLPAAEANSDAADPVGPSVPPAANGKAAATTAPGTDKPSAAKTAAKTGGQAKGQNATVDGDTIHIGNMTIRDGVIETPDTIIDENGVRRKFPMRPKAVPIKPLTPEQMQYLSPEQQQKLEKLIRDQELRRQQIPARPTPGQ